MKRTSDISAASSSQPQQSDDVHAERARELGFVIHPDEKRYMDRLDRKNGQPGSPKRANRSATKNARPKTALEREPRANQAFDSTRTKEEKQYNDVLNNLLPQRRQNRKFEGNDAAVRKALYGSTDVILHRPVDMFEVYAPDNGALHFLTPVMRKRIASFDIYDQAETKLRPIDFQWHKQQQYEQARFPTGCRINLSDVAEFIENNTGFDVWMFQMSLPNNVEKTPDWVVKAFSDFVDHMQDTPANTAKFGMISLADSLEYVGLMTLDLILDPESLFHMRLLYAYGTLNNNAPADADTKFPAGLIKHTDFMRILEFAHVTKGDSRFQLERHDIMIIEPVNPIFSIPATYLGRYYFSPTPSEHIQINSLENRLKENAKLWDTRPLFDDLDNKAEEKKK